MGLLFRNRQVAGNICLVVFLAFMFTILPGQLWTSNAYAAEYVAADNLTVASGANKNITHSEEIKIDPVSDSTFTNTIETLINQIKGTVNNLVYKVTYEKVYGVVYSVYLWYYGVTSGTITDNTYKWVYDNVYGNKSVMVPVKVWNPPDSGHSHSGGGSSSNPPATPPSNPPTPGTAKKFADINGHWAKYIIDMLAAKGIVTGVADGKFAPEKAVTRAEFAVILARALKLTAASSASFADVKPVAWYAAEVAAAKEAGIIKGYGNKFKPNQTITREEMAVMIARALRVAGKLNLVKASEANKVVAKYSDAKKVSAWSKQALASLVKGKVLAGKTAATIVPQGKATRAEAAVFVYRVLKIKGDF